MRWIKSPVSVIGTAAALLLAATGVIAVVGGRVSGGVISLLLASALSMVIVRQVRRDRDANGRSGETADGSFYSHFNVLSAIFLCIALLWMQFAVFGDHDGTVQVAAAWALVPFWFAAAYVLWRNADPVWRGRQMDMVSRRRERRELRRSK